MVGSVAITKRDENYNYANAVEVISYTNPKGRVYKNSTQRNFVFTVGNIQPNEEDQSFTQKVLMTNPIVVKED